MQPSPSRQDAPERNEGGLSRMPALLALALQAIALSAVLLISIAAPVLAGYQIPLVLAGLGQGLIAAGLSWRWLAPWWQPIQFFFPLALIGVHSLQLPPAIFLSGFLLLLGLYWTTFRTQVPFYPSNRQTWEHVVSLLPGHPVRFADIGSGIGGLVLYLAQQRPDSRFTGIEIAPLPWAVSWLRAAMSRSSGGKRCCFRRDDYSRLDFAEFDVIFAYLSPPAMPALWEKAVAEMQPGSLLLSYEFPMQGRAPDILVCPGPHAIPLYGWRL